MTLLGSNFSLVAGRFPGLLTIHLSIYPSIYPSVLANDEIAGWFLGSCRLPESCNSIIYWLFVYKNQGINQSFSGWRWELALWPHLTQLQWQPPPARQNKIFHSPRWQEENGSNTRCRQGKLVVMAKNGGAACKFPE